MLRFLLWRWTAGAGVPQPPATDTHDGAPRLRARPARQVALEENAYLMERYRAPEVPVEEAPPIADATASPPVRSESDIRNAAIQAGFVMPPRVVPGSPTESATAEEPETAQLPPLVWDAVDNRVDNRRAEAAIEQLLAESLELARLRAQDDELALVLCLAAAD